MSVLSCEAFRVLCGPAQSCVVLCCVALSSFVWSLFVLWLSCVVIDFVLIHWVFLLLSLVSLVLCPTTCLVRLSCFIHPSYTFQSCLFLCYLRGPPPHPLHAEHSLPTVSGLALSCLALPSLVLSCLALPCLVLSCRALSCLALPRFALSCLILCCLCLHELFSISTQCTQIKNNLSLRSASASGALGRRGR